MSTNENRTRGMIVECLPNAQFRVALENGEIIRGYMSGKMKLNKIKILLGDTVEMEIPEQGEIYRIVFRVWIC